MTPEEINKKAYEKYPVKMDVEYDSWGNAEDVDLNARRRQGYIEAYNEISSLPTIKGWVARDEDGTLTLFRECDKPFRVTGRWRVNNLDWLILEDDGQFIDLTWADDPIEVELPIIRK